MTTNKKTISIDFDGTICKKQSYGNGEIHETPTEGAPQALSKLKDDGYNIVVYTVRLNPYLEGDVSLKKKRIEDWLDKYGIPYDEVTNNKPSAIAYVDDRGIRFEGNWNSITNYFIQ